jgi:hypothetical protein
VETSRDFSTGLRLKSTETGRLKKSDPYKNSPGMFTNIINIIEATEFEEDDLKSPAHFIIGETFQSGVKFETEEQIQGKKRVPKSKSNFLNPGLNPPKKLGSGDKRHKSGFGNFSSSNSGSNSRSRDNQNSGTLKMSNFSLQNRLGISSQH